MNIINYTATFKCASYSSLISSFTNFGLSEDKRFYYGSVTHNHWEIFRPIWYLPPTCIWDQFHYLFNA